MQAISTWRSAAGSFCCMLLIYFAPAQDLIRFNFRHVSTKAGLSSIFVRKIVQDPFGYMWIGTEDGLNRFDGRNFTVYNKGIPGKHALSGLDTRDLLADTLHHLIWEITSFGGIDAIDYNTGNKVFSYPQTVSRSTAGIVFNSLAIDCDRLYIGSTNGLYILRIATRQLSKAALTNPLRPDTTLAIDNLIRDRAGRLWLFCRDLGTLLLRDSTLSLQGCLPASALIPGSGNILFYDCTQLNDGTILTATSAGLKLFSCANGNPEVRNDPYPAIPISHSREVYSCRQDKQGYIWFSTAGYLGRITPSGADFKLVKDHLSRESTSWLDAVYNIYFDKDDDIWLGCQAGLAFAQNIPSCFTSLTSSAISETTLQHAYYLNPVDDTTLYCCAQEGIYRVNPVTGAITALDNRAPYYQAFLEPKGRLMVSGTEGTFILLHGRELSIDSVYPEFRSLGKLTVTSHCSSGDSLLIMGTRVRGVVIWNYKRHNLRLINRSTPDLWLRDNFITNLYTDHKGLVWVLGYQSISVLDLTHHSIRSVNTYDTLRNISYSLLFDICEARGRYYLAAYGEGVGVLDSAYHFVRDLSVKDGLTANSVYKVIPYKDSLLFITSNHGLSVVDIPARYAVRNFYESDGLHSDNLEEYSGAIRNNIVYIGGGNGITVIDPARFPAVLSPPPVYIRQIVTEDRTGSRDSSNLLLSAMEINNDVLQTNIYLSSIGYQNPERSPLAYRIRELNGGWIDIGTRDLIPLIGLNPGTYTLQLRSANKDGVWSTRPLEFILTFDPKWYQTLWFKLLVILAIGALFYSFYLYRIDQIHKQHQIRKDIASDLHDDIGSTLNSVKIFTHLARREQQKEEYLSRIEDSLSQASMGLRDMIWVLDDSGDTIKELADRIRKFAVPVTQVNHIHFECVVEDEVADRTLTKPIKRNLLLIAKESINNSLKYAECRNIYVSLGEKNDDLVLIISDDGKGFDASGPAAGNGLNNIRIRTRQIGFSAHIESAPGKGTRITISET